MTCKYRFEVIGKSNFLQFFIEFIVISETHENGKWNYKVKTIINNSEYGIGNGSSKKSAEQDAARETFELMGEI